MSRSTLSFSLLFFFLFLWFRNKPHTFTEPHLLRVCKSLHTPVGRPSSYEPSSRIPGGSDRFIPGTPPVLIRNARILTGNLDPFDPNSTDPDTLHGSILLDKGLIIRVGTIPPELVEDVKKKNKKEYGVDLVEDWLIYIRMLEWMADALPVLRGASDGNSHHQPINPFLRSVDGINTHDLSYYLTPAGGVTTAQVLPGSANNIGGQAFLIKMRQSGKEGSVREMVLEPPRGLFDNDREDDYIPWRHMKHACGENPDRRYSQTRMDGAWNFREAYARAQKILQSQNEFCSDLQSRVPAGTAYDDLEKKGFPEDLELEALVDVLRGRVKLSVHCYEAVDLDAMVRLTNEFHFPIASFHHAGETYLVPELLKKAWGGPPAAALFASNARKKREAYRGSEFAPRILADHGIDVVMKSDHPVLPSRHLLYEAQQAFYYGLDSGLAIASVTSTPADRAGVGWRVGRIGVGWDADLVLWDTHPLALGSTPVQVWVDQVPQLPFASDPFTYHNTFNSDTDSSDIARENGPHVITNKPERFQELPKVPDFTKEREEVVKWDGLPPLGGWGSEKDKDGGRMVRFTGVKSMWVRDRYSARVADAGVANVGIKMLFDEVEDLDQKKAKSGTWSVVVKDGLIICYEPEDSMSTTEYTACPSYVSQTSIHTVNLSSGSLSPGFTSFGNPLGLVEIRLEPSTNDGDVWDPLTDGNPPAVFGTSPSSGAGDASITRARDGLFFGGRNTLLAYQAGVTKAITPPSGANSGKFLLGLSVGFHTGAADALDAHGELEAVIKDEVGLHVSIQHGTSVGVSTQVGVLRKLVLGGGGSWEDVRKGNLPFIIHVDNADIMATLTILKYEVEASLAGRLVTSEFVTGPQTQLASSSNSTPETNHETQAKLKMTFVGASEAHLLADEIARAGIAVILSPSRPFPRTWDARRILPGPPLSADTAITRLVKAGVLVGIGVPDEYDAKNLRFEVGWAALDSNGTLSKTQALALGTVNVEQALGLTDDASDLDMDDLVVYQGGGPFDMESKVIGVVSSRRKVVDLF
ncbi:hypothetical protein VKT23_015432 [Stygiomarasmius scandens]|uniref:Amidohydrolase-related domain-containing protein n=1 Tax=Marasmiellus scandens TaxID=2682957 RepID=A0ABR1IXX3_9AGAR